MSIEGERGGKGEGEAYTWRRDVALSKLYAMLGASLLVVGVL